MSVVTMATKVMSPSSCSFEHRLGTGGEFNTCSQQANSPYHRAATSNTAAAATAHLKLKSPSTCSSAFDEDDQDEQTKRNKLIQAATNRLRQKRLEIKLQAMMAQVVEMQCQLDIIKLDTSTSLQLLPSSNISETQLSHFEKRLAQHIADLQQIFQRSSQREEASIPIKHKETRASSTISSLLSNILYSKSNNSNSVMMREEQQQDSDYSILGGSIHHHQKRKKRRHYQQHGSMQNNVVRTSSPPTITSASTSDLFEEIDDEENNISPGSTETTSSVCWSSFDMMSDNNSISVQPLHQEAITNARNRHELLVLHSIPPSSIQAASEISKPVVDRNALDDVLSFLNDAELNTHDDRLVRDIYEILEQGYTSNKLPIATQPTSTSFPTFHLLQKLLDKGMKWIKFAIVMVLAIIINLKKGPQSFL
ncbi:hypothetical protein MAM1_0016d01486 [Mucor ambiguus]|uniref:Uncharacterized protein n=1 Tax=Mucor ambiguus TaxID=91626 RepID=A0A0C9MG06_9FUNG|nr:hypothetical protein MAM1_0016d01486 [Mucor ambiguus]